MLASVFLVTAKSTRSAFVHFLGLLSTISLRHCTLNLSSSRAVLVHVLAKTFRTSMRSVAANTGILRNASTLWRRSAQYSLPYVLPIPAFLTVHHGGFRGGRPEHVNPLASAVVYNGRLTSWSTVEQMLTTNRDTKRGNQLTGTTRNENDTLHHTYILPLTERSILRLGGIAGALVGHRVLERTLHRGTIPAFLSPSAHIPISDLHHSQVPEVRQDEDGGGQSIRQQMDKNVVIRARKEYH
jgi:hypothetical protein